MSNKEKASVDIEGIFDETKEEIILSPEISLEEFEKVVGPIYQEAIDITRRVLENKNLTGKDLNQVILIGGPTKSKTLQRMLKENLGTMIDSSIDPMTAVAKGAAIFASTRDNPSKPKVSSEKVQISLKYPESSPETEIELGIKINRKSFAGNLPGNIFCQIDRSDRGWSSGKIEIVDDAEIVDILLEENKINRFSISLFDEKGNTLKCEPSDFQILPFQIAKPTLPYPICIEAFNFGKGKQLLVPLSGLPKETTLPAKGKNIFRTMIDLRPEISEDKIEIVVYQGTPDTRAIYGDFVCHYILSGKDISGFLPKNSEIEIDIDIDSSRHLSMSIDIPYLNETIQFERSNIRQDAIDENTLSKKINEAEIFLKELENEFSSIESQLINNYDSKIVQLKELFENGKGVPNTRTQIWEDLRKMMIELESEQIKNEFPKTEIELENALQYVKTVNTRYGDSKTSSSLSQLEEQSKVIIKNENTKAARDLITNLYSLAFSLEFQQLGYLISCVKFWDDNFTTINWENKSRATLLISEAKQNIVTNPSKTKLQQLVGELFTLLPFGTPPPRELEGGLGY